METSKNNNNGCGALIMAAIIAIIALFANKSESNSGSYVSPYRTHSGKLVKGHPRKSNSTNPNAIKNRL